MTKKIILSTLILHFLVPEINNLSAQPNFSMSETLKRMSWRAIGPANMGGRVTDIDGVPGDPSTFYVSGADGGIFKTTNGGVSFSPIFEKQRAYSVGALTIASSDNNILWVGTGEVTQEIVLAMAGGCINPLTEECPGNI